MTFRTLIFDLDGTISDPSDGIARSVNYALESFSYDPVEEHRVHRMIGPPLTEIFEHFLGALSAGRMQELVDAYRERYASIGFTENVLYPGVPDTLATLARQGYELGICTSKRADYAARIVEMFGLNDHFGFIDGGDVHIKKFMQLERIVSNGVDATSAVMIGDRAVDIDAAKKNAIASVGVNWGFGHEGELAAAAPTYIAESPADLLEIFK
jgi:phosphoglycolate phosphatase